MALWAGSAINSTETAMVFNRLYNLKAMEMVRKKNALLFKLMGKPDIGNVNENTRLKFERSRIVTGKNIEIKLLGALGAPATVADGSAELATVTRQFSSTTFGAAEFPLTHYAWTQGIPSSQMRRYKGPQAKTAGFYDEVLNYVMLSYQDVLGTAIHDSAGTAVISRTVMGSWTYGVSDGVSTGETTDNFKLYGTIDRSDSANADFRGIVSTSTGALDLNKIRTYANQADANGGVVDTGICGTTLYTKVQQLVEPYVQTNYSEDLAAFGGRYVRYAGIDFMHDQRTTSGVLGLLDSSTWLWVQNDDDLTDVGVIKDPSIVDGYVLPTAMWCQLICCKPNANAKLTGVTG